MQHAIEICLTACEWFERKRGHASASWARKEPETKTVWTFLSQGAVGGALGYFALIAMSASLPPAGWDIIYFYALPLFLVLGAVFGSITAIFIWLLGLLLKRRLNFFARVGAVISGLAVLGVAFSRLEGTSKIGHVDVTLMVDFTVVFYLPIVLLTGTRIRPGHLLLLGAGPRSPRYNLGSWLSVPAGLLLRAVSIFGLLEALLALLLWISNGWAGPNGQPARQYFLAIALAVLYFAASSYFSFKTPRKGFLLLTVILLNAPLAALVIYLEQPDTFEAMFLSHTLQALLCLWAAYTLGRLIAPETSACVPAPESVRNVAGSSAQRNSILKLSSGGACQVQT